MFARLRSFAAGLFHRDRFESSMDDELRFHMAAYADDLVRAGVPRDEAMRRARLQFRAVEAAKEECRQNRGMRWIDEARQDPATLASATILLLIIALAAGFVPARRAAAVHPVTVLRND